MKRTTEQWKELRTGLIVLLLILNGLAMAVDVSWSGTVYPSDGIDVEHVSGSIVLVAEIEDVDFTGLPDNEYSDGTYMIEYRWFVNGTQAGGNSASITLADNQNGINGRGVYTVNCEARCRLTAQNQNNGNDLWTDWQAVGQHNVTFFTLDFQRQDGTIVNSVKVAEDGSENVNAVILPDCSPAITLIKNSSIIINNVIH